MDSIVRREDAPLAQLEAQVRDYVGQARARSTLRGYRADWQDFTTWCQEQGRTPLPATPETVALYLAARAETHRISTLQRRLSAISQAHQAADVESPTRTLAVRAVWAGIRRAKGTAQEGKAAAVIDELRLMLDTLPDTAAGIRDRALLLVGFAGAFRRAELVGLVRGDVEISRSGLVITLRRSKTDQEGAGRKIGIPYGSNPETCPVRCLEDWLELAEISAGPLFRGIDRHGNLSPASLSDRAVALIVKRAAAAAGLDPDRYAGHSLRAGFVTTAAAAGVEERKIMAQTGHKSERMVRKYIRDGALFRDNPAGRVGL